jgi:hypothetical protein
MMGLDTTETDTRKSLHRPLGGRYESSLRYEDWTFRTGAFNVKLSIGKGKGKAVRCRPRVAQRVSGS